MTEDTLSLVLFSGTEMTMDLMGLRREDMVEGLEAPAEATSALLEAEGATTLFI